MKIPLAALAALLGALLPGVAGVVFQQLPDDTGALYQSSVNGTDYDQMTWDRFRLDAASAISGVRWRGGYLHGRSGGTVQNWTVSVYADVANGYQPDVVHAPLYTYTFDGGAGETPAGTLGGTVLFDYSVTLPMPFQLSGSTYYWLLVQANQSGLPDWGIATSVAGNRSCFRRVSNVGDFWYYLAGGDVAFTLLGPEGPLVSILAAPSPPAAGTVVGAGLYPAGSTASLTAVPAAGYGFSGWTEGGHAVATGSPYTFVVSGTRTLTALFVPAFSIGVSALPLYGGAVSGGGSFNLGDPVSVAATPSPGYSFTGWTEGGVIVSTDPVYAFTCNAARNLVAAFSANAGSAEFDFDTGTPPVFPTQGMPSTQSQNGVTATFISTAGSWSVQDTFYGWRPLVFSGNFLYPGTWGSTLAIAFNRPMTNFSMAFFTGDVASEYDVPTTVRATAYADEAMSVVAGTASAQGDWISGAYPEGTLHLKAPGPFVRVKLDMPRQPVPGSDLLFVDNIVVEGAPPPTVSVRLLASPLAGGEVIGAGEYPLGFTVAVDAVPAPGYFFTQWSDAGTVVSTAAHYEFVADGAHQLVATFVREPPTFALITASSPSNGGTTAGDGVFLGGETVTVSAWPASGYDFIQWSEDGKPVATASDYTFQIDAPRLLVATFAPAVSPAVAVKLEPGWVVISWPLASTGFVLEQSASLDSVSWLPVDVSPTPAGDRLEARIPAALPGTFFRLRHP